MTHTPTEFKIVDTDRNYILGYMKGQCYYCHISKLPIAWHESGKFIVTKIEEINLTLPYLWKWLNVHGQLDGTNIHLSFHSVGAAMRTVPTIKYCKYMINGPASHYLRDHASFTFMRPDGNIEVYDPYNYLIGVVGYKLVPIKIEKGVK